MLIINYNISGVPKNSDVYTKKYYENDVGEMIYDKRTEGFYFSTLPMDNEINKIKKVINLGNGNFELGLKVTNPTGTFDTLIHVNIFTHITNIIGDF